MKIEKIHNEIRYTLSNEGLKEGDKVFPIANGRCLNNGEWILHGFDFRDFCSGFPKEPHTILEIPYSKFKPEEVRTDFGYSPADCYYKIIKKEKQEMIQHNRFARYEWIKIE